MPKRLIDTDMIGSTPRRVLSVGDRVIVKVLGRIDGRIERIDGEAAFIRLKDGTLFKGLLSDLDATVR